MEHTFTTRVPLSFHTRAAYIRTAIRYRMSTEEFSNNVYSSTKLAFIYLLMIVFDALRRIFFEDRKRHDVRMMWVCPPTVVIFCLWDPTIIGSRPDTKKRLLFAATRVQFQEPTRGASTAERSSMLQLNETNLRKNAFKKSILLHDCTNQWRAVATKQIFDSRRIKSQPDFLTSLLFGPRSPFWTASCPSKLLFFWKDLFFVLRIPCQILFLNTWIDSPK